MKKQIFTSTILVLLGISIGILLVARISPRSISEVFAMENNLGISSSPIQSNEVIREINNAYQQVAETSVKSVVSIKVESESSMDEQFEQLPDFFRYFYEGPQGENLEKRRRMGSGSGVIVSSDGYIVTNNHVVDGALKNGIEVILHNNQTYQARIIGQDPLTDLAVLKIEENGLNAVHFEEIDNVKIGQIVFAVGSPLGLSETVTSGIISATGRGKLGILNNRAQSGYAVEHFIQTDAAINPGNSGGGLFNINGSLVGINTAIASETGSYIGYGFAIPVNLVKSVTLDLIEDGKINRGYIGVMIKSIEDKAMADYLGLKEVRGVLVTDVVEGGSADLSGIRAEDVLLELDGEKLYTSSQLQSLVTLKKAGDKVKLKIMREGKEIYKEVTLREKDDKNEEIAEKETEKGDKLVNFDDLGFDIKELTSDLKKKYEIDNGVIISNVVRYSIADKKGLMNGGIIHKADRKKINSPNELIEIIEAKKPGDIIMLHVKYKDVNSLIAIEIPSHEG